MKLLIKFQDSAKVINILDSNQLSSSIQKAFCLTTNFRLQRYDKDFDEYVDLDNITDVKNNDKIRVLPIYVAVIEENGANEVPQCSSSSDSPFYDLENNDNIRVLPTCVAVIEENGANEVPQCSSSSDSPFDHTQVNVDGHLNLKTNQWPREIKLPIHEFSGPLLRALECQADLDWNLSREIVDHLANYMYKIKSYPSKIERLQVCNALVEKYPYLKNSVDLGIGGWEIKLLNKLKKIRRSDTSLEVEINRINRIADGCKVPKNIKMNPKRGEVNWAPSHLPGEDELSQNMHKQIMKDASLMSESNQDKQSISDLMAVTYSFRRQEINRKIPIHKLKSEYPIFFQPKEQMEEFFRLTAVSLKEGFFPVASLMGPRLFRLFKKRIQVTKLNDKNIHLTKEISQVFKRETANMTMEQLNSTQASFGLLVLPFLLNEPLDLFVKLKPNEADKEKFSSIFPTILCVGGVHNGKCILIAEGMELCRVDDFVSCVALAMSFFYTLNISYPKELTCTLKFLQNYFLKIECGTLPSKVLTLCRKAFTVV